MGRKFWLIFHINRYEKMNPQRSTRYLYLKFMRLKGSPHSLAIGAALGVFIGIMPVMPLHTLLIILVTLLTRTSTITALLTSFMVSNPFTFIPQYYLSTMIGNVITPFELTWPRIKEALNIMLQHQGWSISLMALVDLGYEAIIVLVAGGIVIALPCAIGVYFLSLRFFVHIRKKGRQHC